MSQIGTIVSCTSDQQEYGTLNWVVQFSYLHDAGGTSQSRVLVGNNPSVFGTAVPPATSALWTGPNSTITVSPNPPGTSVPVTLACPPLVQAAAFGLPLK